MIVDIEQILDDLSYSFSTPEAVELHSYIADKKFNKAKKILLDHTDIETAQRIIEHIHIKNTKKIIFEEIDMVSLNVNDLEQKYLFSYGGELYSGKLYSGKNGLWFWANSSMIDLNKVNQIWKIK